MQTLRVLSITLLCTAGGVTAAPPSHVLTRTVIDAKGAPITGVRVTVLRSDGAESVTDSAGVFRLEYGNGRILLEHQGHGLALIKPGHSTEIPAVIVLQPQVPGVWELPKCGRTPRHVARRGLLSLRLRLPRGAVKVDTGDVDYELARIQDSSHRFELRHWERAVSGGRPSGFWFAGLDEVSTRLIDVGGTRGYDVRGRSANGLMSRWVGVFYTFVEYKDVDPSVAQVFDEAIDRVCIK